MNWVVRQLQMRPDEVAVRFDENTLTWRELADRAQRVAAGLHLAGVRPGARIATLLQAGVDYVTLVAAAMWTGTVLVPLNTSLADDAVSRQLRDSEADILVFDDAEDRDLELWHVRFVRIHELMSEEPCEPVLMRTDEAAAILYTSGTSGEAKPVRLTWRNFEASALASAVNLGVRADDDWICCMPMYHVGGLAIAMRTMVYGTRMTLLPKFDAEAVLSAIDKGGTLLSLVPTMLVRLVEHVGGVDNLANRIEKSNLRAILLGGGPPDRAFLLAAIEAGLPVYQTYGMTETASQITTMPPDRIADKIGSAGYPLWSAELSIRDAQGEPVSHGPGTVWVRGPMVSSGYLERPEVNRQRFVGGWFTTGDRGQLDEDGFLWIIGRHDDVIISGGENVNPDEVEDVLRGHPDIREVAIFGVRDEIWGERVTAAVVVDECVGFEDLDAFCRENLAAHQRPRSWVVLSELPRTSTGKIRRRWLAAQHG